MATEGDGQQTQTQPQTQSMPPPGREHLLGLGGAAPGVAAALLCGAAAVGAVGAEGAVAVAGLLALPFGLCSWLSSSARVSLAGEPALTERGLVTAGVAAAVAAPALAIFGALLKANTH